MRWKTKVTGASVKKERLKLGLTQKEVGKLSGLSQMHISHIERMGSKTLLSGTAKKLVPFFGGKGKDAAKKKKSTKKKTTKKQIPKKTIKKKVAKKKKTIKRRRGVHGRFVSAKSR